MLEVETGVPIVEGLLRGKKKEGKKKNTCEQVKEHLGHIKVFLSAKQV